MGVNTVGPWMLYGTDDGWPMEATGRKTLFISPLTLRRTLHRPKRPQAVLPRLHGHDLPMHGVTEAQVHDLQTQRIFMVGFRVYKIIGFRGLGFWAHGLGLRAFEV